MPSIFDWLPWLGVLVGVICLLIGLFKYEGYGWMALGVIIIVICLLINASQGFPMPWTMTTN